MNYRKKMERYIGRPLRSDEHIHHRNGRRSDNRISNLQIVSPGEHRQIHGVIRNEVICADCGKAIDRLLYPAIEGRGGNLSLLFELRRLNQKWKIRFLKNRTSPPLYRRYIKKRSDVRARDHAEIKRQLAELLIVDVEASK